PFGPMVGARYAAAGGLVPQGISAELIADRWQITREEMDRYAAESQRRAAQATAEGRFDREIVPVDGADGRVMASDEGIRDTTLDTLAGLKPAFLAEDQGGRVTAGNSSQITDGAA